MLNNQRMKGFWHLFVAVLGIVGSLMACSTGPTARQQMVHQMGAQVMPFALDKTQHIFTKTDAGGIQKVIVLDARDQDQLPMIRHHLMHEAMLFSQGNFDDPQGLHGEAMAGLAALKAGFAGINFVYSELPNGGQITYSTADPQLIEALHQWFDAQVSDHGSDAVMK